MSRFDTDLDVPKNKRIDPLACVNYQKPIIETKISFQPYVMDVRGTILQPNKKNKDDDDINVMRIKSARTRNINNNTVRGTNIEGLRKSVEYMFTDADHETEWWNP